MTPGRLDPADIKRVVRSVHAVDPLWVSVFLGCRRRPEAELSYPQAVSLNGTTLAQAIDNCLELIDAGVRPLLVENVTAFGIADGAMRPAQFINRLCEESGCGLLLDVTALTLDERFGFDPRRWLWDVDPTHVAAMHLGGWARRGMGRWAGRHEGRVSDEAWTLARELVDRTPVSTAVLQREERCSSVPELREDLRRLASLDRVAAPALSLPEPAFAVR